MTLHINNYDSFLKNTKTHIVNQNIIHPPHGSLEELVPKTIDAIVLPPTNSHVDFTTLTRYEHEKEPTLSELQTHGIPKKFNWIEDGKEKSKLISSAGNQMLCGSCWAISTAGIVADNHVVAGTVDYKPNLSTTWSLACYPQSQCKGGNPSLLLDNIHKNGLSSNSCVDYSWCATNENCNGKATQHFKESKHVDLSTLIPNCGCYNSNSEHLLYFIDKPKRFSLQNNIDIEHFRMLVKKHIITYGPVLGGFLVFRNFMSGGFTKVNGGIYLENGIYDEGKVYFQNNYANANNFVGSHAISIIGWGEEEIVVNNKGTREVVPYWKCLNSWTNKWGENGTFKMAMYPYNKLSQFDKVVILSTNSGNVMAGGMVTVKASGPPQQFKLPQIQNAEDMLKLKPNEFYDSEIKTKPNNNNKSSRSLSSNVLKIIGKIIIILLVVFLLNLLIRKVIIPALHRKNENYNSVQTINNNPINYNTNNNIIPTSKVSRIYSNY